MELNLSVLFFILGFVTGAIFLWLKNSKSQVELALFKERETNSLLEISNLKAENLEIQNENEALQLKSIESEKDAARLSMQAEGLTQMIQNLNNERAKEVEQLSNDLKLIRSSYEELRALAQNQSNEIAQLTTSLDSEKKQSEEKIALLQNAEQQLSERFKNIAAEILEDKSKRFTEQNQTNLSQLLNPLKDKITEFKSKVEEVYIQEGKERSALGEQVKQLMELNNKLSDDAHNLTRALKGQAKTQGNWGEVILERVLSSSGLRKGHEYDVQENHVRDDQSRAQPDVVIHLPEDKHLIVDAKVSIVAYEEYSNADTDALRESALKRHKESIRNHVKGLSDKNYQKLYGLKSLDFVLMFVPIEPAFMLAISNDNELWNDAWKRNVLLVSPSTLLFVLRTVAHLWRQEQQNKNAQEIADRGASLYDKLVSFVEDLDKVGQRIDQAKNSYDQAYGKFKSGSGNVIRQAEMLKSLGVKPNKSFDSNLIADTSDLI